MMCMSKYKTNKITKFILNLHSVLLCKYFSRTSKAAFFNQMGLGKLPKVFNKFWKYFSNN